MSSVCRTPFDPTDYSERTRQRHVCMIREFYSFRAFDEDARQLLLEEIVGMVRSQIKPKLMLWRCVDALVQEKIELPSYTRLTKIILGAINHRKNELTTAIEDTLANDTRALLDTLLMQAPIDGGVALGKTST